jgi:hypothetical protein
MYLGSPISDRKGSERNEKKKRKVKNKGRKKKY